MQRISASYIQLAQAIDTGTSVVITNDNQWYERHWLSALFHRVVGWDKSDTIEAASRITKYIQKLPIESQTQETQGLSAPRESLAIQTLLTSVKNAVERTKQSDFEKLQDLKTKKRSLKAEGGVLGQNISRDEIENGLRKLKAKIQEQKKGLQPIYSVTAEIENTRLSFIALEKSQNEISQTQANEGDKEWLTSKVQKFLNKQRVQISRPESPENLEIKIDRATRYPEFIQAIKTNPTLRDSFVKTICRGSPHGSQDSVDVFIQAPYIQKLLTKSFLDKRLQRIANDGLKLVEQNHKKEVQLLIHGRHQPISYLEGQVQTSPEKFRTASSLFKEFQALNDRLLDVEYVQTGVEEYDFKLKNFNFDQENWWEQLPDIEVQSVEWVRNRFNDQTIDPNKPLLVIHATRTTEDLNPVDTHGYMDIYIPKGDGTFNIISPGKYGDTFLPTMKEKGFSLQGLAQKVQMIFKALKTVFSTQGGVYVLADQNNYMTHRHHKEIPLPQLSQEKFQVVMNFIKDMFVAAREGRMHFQPQADNCTSPLQILLQNLYPNVEYNPFQVRFLDLNPPTALKWIKDARVLFRTDEQWNEFRKVIAHLFGATEERIYQDETQTEQRISLTANRNWQEGRVPLPANLFQNGVAERFLEQVQLHA